MKTRIMIILFFFSASSVSNAAASGTAETVSCNAAWGGVSGNCQMTKTVEIVLGTSFSDDWDRLDWSCQVRRELLTPGNFILVASDGLPVQVVPSRPLGASWTDTITVQTNQQKSSTKYCTRNRSIFYHAENANPSALLGFNAVDITGCETTPNRNDEEDY